MEFPKYFFHVFIFLGFTSTSARIYSRESEPILNTVEVLQNPDASRTVIPLSLVGLTPEENATLEKELSAPPLNPDEFENAETLNDHPLDLMFDEDPILRAALLEGDIQIENQEKYYYILSHVIHDDKSPFPFQRNGIRNMDLKWPDAIVPYKIDRAFSSSEVVKIMKAMKDIETQTCVRFKLRKTEKDYVYIMKGNGCSSAVGRVGGKQSLSLANGCVHHGVIVHEMIHALGFWHEHSRADRDSYVRINWDNIRSSMRYNFNKYSWDISQSFGVGYDLGSVMHYGPRAFSISNKHTITPIGTTATIGQRNGMSQRDIAKINKLYQCFEPEITTMAPKTTPRPVPTVTNTPPPVSRFCVDDHDHNECAYWAKIGECKKNPKWMLSWCRRSCKVCECKDVDSRCSRWAGKGYCHVEHVDYMEINCPASCGYCDGTPEPPPPPPPACKDNNKDCSPWAKAGECNKNPSYMKVQCKKSCHVC